MLCLEFSILRQRHPPTHTHTHSIANTHTHTLKHGTHTVCIPKAVKKHKVWLFSPTQHSSCPLNERLGTHKWDSELRCLELLSGHSDKHNLLSNYVEQIWPGRLFQGHSENACECVRVCASVCGWGFDLVTLRILHGYSGCANGSASIKVTNKHLWDSDWSLHNPPPHTSNGTGSINGHWPRQ